MLWNKQMNVKEMVLQNLYNVQHEELQDSNLILTNTVVKANDREEALIKYNGVAKMRSDYPLYWNQVSLGSVKQLVVLA